LLFQGHIYRHNPHFHPRPGWLGIAGDSLYFFPQGGVGKKHKNVDGTIELGQVDTQTLTIVRTLTIRESFLRRRDSPHVMFSDGTNVAIVTTNTAGDNFVARFYSASTNDNNEPSSSAVASTSVCLMSCVNELPLKLARKCIEVIGAPLVEDSPASAVSRGKKHQVNHKKLKNHSLHKVLLPSII
jgi:hypothetical protein